MHVVALTDAGQHWRRDPEPVGPIQFLRVAPAGTQHFVSVVTGHGDLEAFYRVERVNCITNTLR